MPPLAVWGQHSVFRIWLSNVKKYHLPFTLWLFATIPNPSHSISFISQKMLPCSLLTLNCLICSYKECITLCMAHTDKRLSCSPCALTCHTLLIYSLDYYWLSERFYQKINSLWRLWYTTAVQAQSCHPYVAPTCEQRAEIKHILLIFSIDFFITLIR